MNSDSDEGHPTSSKRRKTEVTLETGKKGWEAKKLKKLRRQQKLLDKIDKNKFREDNKNKDIPSESRKKKKQKVEVEQSNDATTAVTGEDEIKGRQYTVSIAVAGSIIDNAQSGPLKAYLVGQVARAAAIFCVDEVIVFDDTGGHGTHGCEQMARILQFLECPQYLRKILFPIHPDLQYAGLIAPLDIPHHLRKHEALPYREGVVSSKPMKDGKEYALVNVGLDRDCRVLKKLPQGVRVTVKFDDPSPESILKVKGKLKGSVVSPHCPRRDAGLYWGYTVRLASGLGKVFSECPFRGGYDVKLGTSDKGTDSRLISLKPFNHLLIVFGGVEGLEYALENDESSTEDDVSSLFDHYVNTCPQQGSRTIRTEEAIIISMTALASIIASA